MTAPGQVRATVTLTGPAAGLVDALASGMATAPATAVRAAVVLLLDVLASEARRTRWTLPEVGAAADALGGTLLGPGVGPVAAGEVADALALDEDAGPGAPGTGLADRWGVDGRALVDRLLRLGPAGDLALRVAVARWWREGREHTPAGWAAVGLVVDG